MIHCYQPPVKQELTTMHQSQPHSYSQQVYANFNQQAQQQESDQSHSNQMQQQQQQQPRRPHESSQTNSGPLVPATAGDDIQNMAKQQANEISLTKSGGQQQPTLIDTTRHLNLAGGQRDSPAEFKHAQQHQHQQEHSTTELYDRLYGGRLMEDEHLEASLQEDWTSHLHGFDFGALHQQVSHDQFASSREHTATRDDNQLQQAYRQQNNYSNQQVAIVDNRKPAHDFNNNNNNNDLDTTSTLSFAPLMPIVDTNQQQQQQQQHQREQQPTNNDYYQSYDQSHQQLTNAGNPYPRSRMSPTSSVKQESITFAVAQDNHQVAPRYHYTSAPACVPLQQQQQHHNYSDEPQHQETSFQDYYTYTNFEPTSGDQHQQQQQAQTHEYHTFDSPYQSQQPHFRLTECSSTETNTSYSLQLPPSQQQQNQQQDQQQQSFSDHNHPLLVSYSSASSPSASSSPQSSASSSPASSSGASSTSSAENHPKIVCAPTKNETGSGGGDATIKTLMKSLATAGGVASTKQTSNAGGGARSRRGRPRKKGANAKGKVSGKLWEFIRDLLLSERTNPSFIRWERREDGVFKFVQSDKVAKMWGERKQNPKMTYEKLSRAMRYYYKSKVLLPVFGRRLVYKFGPNATGWMPATMPLGVPVAQAPRAQSGSSSISASGDMSPVAPSNMTLVYHHHHQHESAGMIEQPHTIHYGSAEHLQQHHNNHLHHHNNGQQQQVTTGALPTTATKILRLHDEIIY